MTELAPTAPGDIPPTPPTGGRHRENPGRDPKRDAAQPDSAIPDIDLSRPETWSADPAHTAELLRERIYGDIACLSTLLVLAEFTDQEVGAWGAALQVLIATGGLWAASVLAEFVAHLGVQGRAPRRRDLVLMFRTAGQILEAAVLPLLLLALSGLGVWPLHTALWVSVWLLIATMGLFALLAARRTSLAWWAKALLVVALMGLGVLVVGLKMLAH